VSGWFYFTLYLSYSPLIACNGQLKGYSFSSVFIFIFFESTFDWDLRANIRNIWGKKLSLVSNYISTLYKKSRDCCAQLLVSALFVTMRLFSYPLFMDSMAPCLQWIGSLTWTPWLYGCNDGSVRFVRMPWLDLWLQRWIRVLVDSMAPWWQQTREPRVDSTALWSWWSTDELHLLLCHGYLSNYSFNPFDWILAIPSIITSFFLIIAFNFYFIKPGSWIATVWGSGRLVSFNQSTG
jgi:hypothetical protein